MIKKIFIAIIIWSSAAAYAVSSPGDNSCEFLNIVPGARGASLGGAFTAGSDITSLYWNPAGIASLERMNASFSHVMWMGQATYDNIMFVYPASRWTAGAMIDYVGVESVTGLDEYGFETGDSFAPGDFAFTGSWAMTFRSRYSSGLSLKFIQSKLTDEIKGSAIAADLGGRAAFMDGKIKAGFAVKNLGTKIKLGEKHPLPMNLNLGAGYYLENITVLADIGFMPFKVSAGAEYARDFGEIKAKARLGYGTGSGKMGGLAGVAAGLGIGWRDYRADYAWLPKGDLGVTNMITVSAMFGDIVEKEDMELFIQQPDASTSIRQINSFVAGKVVDKDKKPVEKATIKIEKDGKTAARVFTDRKGIYQGEPLEPGTYDMKVWKKGYITQQVVIEILNDKPVKADFIIKQELKSEKE